MCGKEVILKSLLGALAVVVVEYSPSPSSLPVTVNVTTVTSPSREASRDDKASTVRLRHLSRTMQVPANSDVNNMAARILHPRRVDLVLMQLLMLAVVKCSSIVTVLFFFTS